VFYCRVRYALIIDAARVEVAKEFVFVFEFLDRVHCYPLS